MSGAGGVRVGWIGLAVSGLCVAVFAAVFGRVAMLQSSVSEPLVAAVGSRHGVVVTPAVRGTLHDRRGRLIASTRFGSRVFIDPVSFESPPGEAVVRLAEALGLPASSVGERVIGPMLANAAAVAAGGADAPQRRYVRLTGVLDDLAAERVRRLGLAGVHLERVPVREYTAHEDLASLIGKVGASDTGLLGMEHAFESRLTGLSGSARYVRDAGRRPMWIEPGTWRASEHGASVRVSVDLAVQRIALEELQRGVLESGAAGGRVLVADPSTGEILAMADLVRELPDAEPYPWWPADRVGSGPVEVPARRYAAVTGRGLNPAEPAMARNRCVEDVYEPGSSFKPFVWALLTESGLVTLDETFDTGQGFWVTPYRRIIRDVTARPEMTWREVLINSSNIGMVKASSRMSFDALRVGVRSLGFGSRTRVGLPGEAAGLVTDAADWSKYTQTSVSFGHEIAVTPMQVVRAFSAFCRTGDLAGTIPDMTLLGAAPGGSGVSRRAFSGEVAREGRLAMAEVAARVERLMHRHLGGERGWRYTMFGKSGTADLPLGPAPEGYRRPPGASGYLDGQYVTSFVAGAPVAEPRIALVVVIDDPGPERIADERHYGSWTAGPVARRIAERTLAYLGVEPDVPPAVEDDG
ncbi:MAG: penicillin-binding protein 2 [Planctomycetota bacterium]